MGLLSKKQLLNSTGRTLKKGLNPMTALSNKFRYQLEHTSDFIISFELIPGYSGRGRSLQKVLDFAKSAAEDGILDTLTLTDNPGGNPSLSPDELGKRIADIGIAPVIHITCRDSNRFGMFSRIQQLDRMGIQNLLALTGDYPAELPSGIAKPCFDLDSVSLLCLLKKMNLGLQPFCMRAKGPPSSKTDFFPGAAVSCYKFSEAEQFTQYFKLLKKIRNGAQFVITQLCYDARKFHELLLFLKSVQIDVPVIGTVYMLTEPVARFMNVGKVPGAFVTNKLYQLVADEAKAKDKGKSALLERTARLLAVLKGLGYRGAHIGGSPIYKDVKEVIRHFADIQDDWRSFLPEFNFPYKNGFYLYRPDPETRLNSTTPSRGSHRAVTRASEDKRNLRAAACQHATGPSMKRPPGSISSLISTIMKLPGTTAT